MKTEPIEEFRPDDITVEAFESPVVRVKEEPRDDIDDVEECSTDDCVEVIAACVQRRNRLRKTRFEETMVDMDLRHQLRETQCRLRDALAEIERLQRIQGDLEQENARLIKAKQVGTKINKLARS